MLFLAARDNFEGVVGERALKLQRSICWRRYPRLDFSWRCEDHWHFLRVDGIDEFFRIVVE
jgi:hypothetical protein